MSWVLFQFRESLIADGTGPSNFRYDTYYMHEHKININLLCALRFRFSLPSSLIEHDQVGVQFDYHPIGLGCLLSRISKMFWKSFRFSTSSNYSCAALEFIQSDTFLQAIYAKIMFWRFRSSLAHTNQRCIRIYAWLRSRLESTESAV